MGTWQVTGRAKPFGRRSTDSDYPPRGGSVWRRSCVLLKRRWGDASGRHVLLPRLHRGLRFLLRRCDLCPAGTGDRRIRGAIAPPTDAIPCSLSRRRRRTVPVRLSDPIFTTLDPDQRRAVLHDAGPLLLVAGAGSGKTRAIVARIVRLIRDGVPARSILGITFTNRAAGEMRERVAKALAPGVESSIGDVLARSFDRAPGTTEVPWLGTFHAFGAILLRRHGGRIGLSPRFVIYDARDQHDVLKRILKELNVDEKKFPPTKFAWLIERAKRDGVSVEQAALSAGWRVVTTAGQVGKAYDDALVEAGAVDFTDLIRLHVTLLRGAPDVLTEVRSEVRHLLVDEFQDVDGAQAELTALLAGGADSFCAVGDEDQSIYGWRGASAEPMLLFEHRFPGAKVIHLSTNYRSRAAILSVAGALISKNRSRREKTILPARGGGELPAVAVYADQEAEAQEVAAAAAREIRGGVAPTEIAVFYRVNAQSRAIEDALRMLRIPYVLRGALSFYDRAAVRDAVSYLKWFLHPDDAVSLKRLLKFPRRGVGEVTLNKAREAARREGIPPSEALARIPNLAPLFSFRTLWLEELPQMSPAEALHALLKGGGYLDALEAAARERGGGRAAGVPREGDAGGGRGGRRGIRGGAPDDAAQRQGIGVRRGVPRRAGRRASPPLPVAGLPARHRGGAAPPLCRTDPRAGAGVPVARPAAEPVRLVPGNRPVPVPLRSSGVPHAPDGWRAAGAGETGKGFLRSPPPGSPHAPVRGAAGRGRRTVGTAAQGAASGLRGREDRGRRGGGERPEGDRAFPGLRTEEDPRPGRYDGVFRVTPTIR